jgi:NAD(P)-dependent dehydrogenase (short-subunit alcohol dehydrogenase family)/acyl carrier protein
MLSMEMDLEQDLGIDSIKRVEILSAMVKRAPQLPEIDAEAMISLRTLGQIADYLEQSLAAIAAIPGPGQAARSDEIRSLLVEVVSQKTGYPAEMLSMEMDLEQDLGIDSIKRVEILSAMVKQAPHLPEIDSEAMIALHTLGQIVEHIQGAQKPAAAVLQESAESPAPALLHDQEPVAPVQRYVIEAVPAPPLGLCRPGLFGQTKICITDDGTGMAPALEAVLNHRGVNAEAMQEIPANATRIIFLGGLRRVTTVDEAIAVNREAFQAARALAGEARLFVTVQDTGGAFGLTGCSIEQAYLGGLAGLAKTVARERPDMVVKAIDLERGERTTGKLAIAIADELLGGGLELEVGLPEDGRRLTLRSLPAPVEPGAPALEAGAVIVASGGARGVTAVCLERLAQQLQPRLVLLGRTPLDQEPACCHGVEGDAGLKRALLQAVRDAGDELTPAGLDRQARRITAVREIRATIAELEAAGARVRYDVVDVTDAAAVAGIIAEVRQAWGGIDGIIHGAGVIADHLIADKSEEEFDLVFNTKVAGLRALLDATSEDRLALLCLFSSVAGRCGNPGQADYAMANEVLNKVAEAEHRRRGTHCLVRSLGWGPWDGGMVTPELKARFEEQGVPVIGLDTGARMLADELSSSRPDQVELVLGGDPRHFGRIGTASELRLDVLVDQYSHPFLADHAIDGVPVVPVVLVMEWFARAAAALHPGLHLAALRDIRVLRGIRLERFSDGGHCLSVRAQPSAGNGGTVSLTMTLESGDGALHYQAEAELVAERVRTNGHLPQLQLQGWDGRGVYGGALFHGPQFQVIRNVDGASDEGIAATICGITQLTWSREHYQTDPAAFDGGLQLAVLWTEQMLGGASLPTRIGEVRTLVDEPQPGELHCLVKGRSAANGHAVSDIYLQDHEGRLVAVLNQVETHLRPSRVRAN